jgi:uncharacterized OB-fold protein
MEVEVDINVRGPVLDGWFTLDQDKPHLMGARCSACGTYYFPKAITFCRNPDCAGEQFEEVELSRTGRLWSYTNAVYKPPEPYVVKEPFVPYSIAAVELGKERMIVLGQVAAGIGVEALRVGMAVELVLEQLDDGKLCWKWKPVAETAR